MDNAIINTCPTVLLIGYGNDLRSDDAAGLRVSDAIAQGAAPFGSIASWRLANVSTFCVHQLTPELAEILAKADIAIFVDAYPAIVQQDVQVCPIELAHTTN